MKPRRRDRSIATAVAIRLALAAALGASCTRLPPDALLAPRPAPKAAAPGRDEVWIRWLGTAGFEIRTARTTILIDPFLSRPALWRTHFGTLEPSERAIAAHVGQADYILVSHTHYDHVMDAGPIARLTGAVVVGSGSAMNVARAYGVGADHLMEVQGGEVLGLGDFRVRPLPSEHGKILLGMAPLEGDITEPPALPPRASDYRIGKVFGYLLETGDRSIYHHGSAGLREESLKGARAEVLLLGVAGSGGTPNYVRRILTALRPRILIPCHFDDFFIPFEEGLRVLGSADIEGVLAEAKRTDPSLNEILLGYFQEIHLPRLGPLSEGGKNVEILDRRAGGAREPRRGIVG